MMNNSSISTSGFTMDKLPHGWWREFFGGLFVCTTVVAVFINACVLLMMYKNKSIRTPSNIILASLAFIDFFTGAIAAPLYAAQLLNADVIALKSLEELRRYWNCA